MRSLHNVYVHARRSAILGAFVLVAIGLTGCPPSWPFPLNAESVYGHNQLILRNEGDRAITGLFLIRSDAPDRGRNYIAIDGGLGPSRAIVVDQIRNGTYTVEIDYLLAAEESGTGAPVLATQRIQNLKLYWGESYTWYWYGPSADIDLAPITPPVEEDPPVEPEA